MDRNILADLQAVAAMPGLEAIADVIEEHHPRSRKTVRDPLALAVFLGAKGVVPSGNMLESLLQDYWDVMRMSAAKVGRDLPAAPPTASQFHKLLVAAPDIAAPLSDTLIDSGTAIARASGMLNATERGSLLVPKAENVLLADGTVIEAMSDVRETADGEIVGSRAADLRRARVATQYRGKPHDRNSGTGLPFAAVSVHGRVRWARVVPGMRSYTDGNELGATVPLLEQVLNTVGTGAQAIAYDMLLSPKYMERLIHRAGVVPLVAMPNRRVGTELQLPEDLWLHRPSGVVTKLRIASLGIVDHDTTHGRCAHALWAVGGALVVSDPRRVHPTLDDPPADLVRLRRHRHGGHHRLEGTYRIPCRHAELLHTVDFTGPHASGTTHLLNVLRPLPEHDARWPSVHGWRSDVESLFSTIQRKLPVDGRATRLDIDRFAVDMVGHALATNAVCWDVHAAQHTQRGADQHRRLAAGSRS